MGTVAPPMMIPSLAPRWPTKNAAITAIAGSSLAWCHLSSLPTLRVLTSASTCSDSGIALPMAGSISLTDGLLTLQSLPQC